MPNAWIEHIRAFAKRNDITYSCAVGDTRCKEEYYKQKSRNAKKTRTPAKEAEGMGGEDINVAKKMSVKSKTPKASKQVIDNFDLLKKISGFVRKPIVFEDDENLQQLSYAFKLLSDIDIILDDSDDSKVGSKAFRKHLSDRIGLVSYSKYFDYENMTEDELKPLYEAEADYYMTKEDLVDIADDYGMDIKFSRNDEWKIISAKLQKNPKGLVSWLYDFVEEQKKKKQMAEAKKSKPKKAEAPKASKQVIDSSQYFDISPREWASLKKKYGKEYGFKRDRFNNTVVFYKDIDDIRVVEIKKSRAKYADESYDLRKDQEDIEETGSRQKHPEFKAYATLIRRRNRLTDAVIEKYGLDGLKKNKYKEEMIKLAKDTILPAEGK